MIARASFWKNLKRHRCFSTKRALKRVVKRVNARASFQSRVTALQKTMIVWHPQHRKSFLALESLETVVWTSKHAF